MRLHIIGVDPGFAAFGVAVGSVVPSEYNGNPYLEFERVEVWRTSPSKVLRQMRKSDDTAARMAYLAKLLHELLDHYRPVIIGCEAIALPYGKVQFSVVSGLGRVRGMIDALAEVYQVPVLEEGPMRLKRALTGSPSATKAQVQQALEVRYPQLRDMWPAQTTLHEHAADACASVHLALESGEMATALEAERQRLAGLSGEA